MTTKTAIRRFLNDAALWHDETPKTPGIKTIVAGFLAGVSLSRTDTTLAEAALQFCNAPAQQSQLEQILRKLPPFVTLNRHHTTSENLTDVFAAVLQPAGKTPSQTPHLAIMAGIRTGLTATNNFGDVCMEHLTSNTQRHFIANQLFNHLAGTAAKDLLYNYIAFTHQGRATRPFLLALLKANRDNIPPYTEIAQSDLWLLLGMGAALDVHPRHRQSMLAEIPDVILPIYQKTAEAIDRRTPDQTFSLLSRGIALRLPKVKPTNIPEAFDFAELALNFSFTFGLYMVDIVCHDKPVTFANLWS